MIHQSSEIALSKKSLALVVSGIDACKFLQGQLSCDVAALADGQSTLGAYCNIKGKVQSLFNLLRKGDEYILFMHTDLLAPTMQELQKYAVFSKVKMALAEQNTAEINAEAEILAQIPALYPETVGEFFPADINLPALGGVSFTKGCYRGQEIVARMHHRGNLKRKLQVFRMTKADVQPGQVISNQDGKAAGTVVRIYDKGQEQIGLAVITDTYVAEQLFISDAEITLDLPTT